MRKEREKTEGRAEEEEKESKDDEEEDDRIKVFCHSLE